MLFFNLHYSFSFSLFVYHSCLIDHKIINYLKILINKCCFQITKIELLIQIIYYSNSGLPRELLFVKSLKFEK